MSDQEIIHLLVECSQTGVATLLSKEHAAGGTIPEQDKVIFDQIISELEAQQEE